MTRPPEPQPIHPKEFALALLVAALLWLCLAFIFAWVEHRKPKADLSEKESAEEEFVAEFRVEDEPIPEKEERQDTPLEPQPADPKNTTTTTPDSTVKPEPQKEKEEEVAPPKEEPQTVVLIEDDVKRQSVDQPTTNQETPDTDDYYLAEVDNRADVETTAEDATTEYDDTAPVDANAHQSDTTDKAAVPEPTRDQETKRAQQPNETRDSERDDAHDVTTQGAENAPQEEQKQSEAAAKSPRDQDAQVQGDRVQESTTSPIEKGDRGAIQQQPETQSAEAFGKASGLGSKMQEAAKRSEEQGKGQESVTRKGAQYAKDNFDEVLGERTAEYQKRAEQTRREESLLGDQAGDWQRTRQAMENYDIAVTPGSETHLNTRRDDHAPFINAYHAKIHDEWWKIVQLIDRKRGDRETSISDSMATTLEIRVLSDGTVDKVGVVRTSGDTFMDAEAIRVNYAVKKAPAPSSKTLCDDGSVYLHWQFSRGPARCSTQGASLHCPKPKNK